MRTISEGVYPIEQLMLGKTAAGSKLLGCGTVYRRESVCDGLIAGVSQNMLVFVLLHL